MVGYFQRLAYLGLDSSLVILKMTLFKWTLPREAIPKPRALLSAHSVAHIAFACNSLSICLS